MVGATDPPCFAFDYSGALLALCLISNDDTELEVQFVSFPFKVSSTLRFKRDSHDTRFAWEHNSKHFSLISDEHVSFFERFVSTKGVIEMGITGGQLTDILEMQVKGVSDGGTRPRYTLNKIEPYAVKPSSFRVFNEGSCVLQCTNRNANAYQETQTSQSGSETADTLKVSRLISPA